MCFFSFFSRENSFFVDAGTNKFASMDTAGNGGQVIIEDPGAHFFGLGVDQTYNIYFSDWNIEFSSLRLSKIKKKAI